MATHYVRVKSKMVLRTLWSGINATMAAVLFFAFYDPWKISANWDAVDTFLFCSFPCSVGYSSDSGVDFTFYDMVLYWIRVKHISYCSPFGHFYMTFTQMSMVEPLVGTMEVVLGDQSMLSTSPLKLGHLHVPRRFYMESHDIYFYL